MFTHQQFIVLVIVQIWNLLLSNFKLGEMLYSFELGATWLYQAVPISVQE